MNKRLVKKKGLTIIEILIYATLLSIILGFITNFLYQVNNFRINNQIDSDLFQNNLLIMNKLSQDIKKAQEVTTPADENFTSTLVLETEEGQITYLIDEGVLKRNGLGLTDNKVTADLGPPNNGFRKINNTIQVKISLEAQLKPFSLPNKKNNYQTTIFLSGIASSP